MHKRITRRLNFGVSTKVGVSRLTLSVWKSQQQTTSTHFSEHSFHLPVQCACTIDREIRVGRRWANTGDARRANRGLILMADGFRRTPPLFYIPLHPTPKTDMIGRVDINTQLIHRQELGVDQCKKRSEEQRGSQE